MNQNYSRKCIVTGQILPVYQLLRFVLQRDGTIRFQHGPKLPGRGAYCQNHPLVVEELFRRKLLNRSFKTNISINTYEQLKEEVRNHGPNQQEKPSV